MRPSLSKFLGLTGFIAIGCVLALSGVTGAFSASRVKVKGNIPITQMDAASKKTQAVMMRHAEAVKSRNLEAIAADYSEDVMLVISLFEKPIVGKAELKRAIAKYLKMPTNLMGTGELRLVRQDFVGEYGYWTFENPANGKIATETYVIRNGKIVFESATFPPELRAD